MSEILKKFHIVWDEDRGLIIIKCDDGRQFPVYVGDIVHTYKTCTLTLQRDDLLVLKIDHKTYPIFIG